MKLIPLKKVLLSSITIITLACAVSSQADTGQPKTSARVFISGHSLTYDPLGEWIGKIAESLDKDYNYNEHLVGGSPIRVRTVGLDWQAKDWRGYKQGKNKDGENMDVISELKSPKTLGKNEKYDTLIITERHNFLNTLLWEDTTNLLRHYHDRFIDGNKEGKTYFYQSWQDIDKKDPALWLEHTQKELFAWECVASKVNLTLEAEGRKDRIETLPAGAALADLVQRVINNEVKGLNGSTESKLNALFQDNVHLTPTGVYYMALISYAAIYQSSPVDATIPRGVKDETAEDLQKIAWSYAQKYYAQKTASKRDMAECREYIADKVSDSYSRIKNDPSIKISYPPIFRDANHKQNPFRWPDPQLKPYPAP